MYNRLSPSDKKELEKIEGKYMPKVDKVARVKPTDEKLQKDMRFAVYDKDKDRLRQVMRLGADIDVKDSDGFTLLMERILAGDTKRVFMLLEAGADPNIPCKINQWEQMPLTVAASEGHLEIVKMLIKSGASLTDNDAMIAAAKAGHPEIVEFIQQIKQERQKELKQQVKDSFAEKVAKSKGKNQSIKKSHSKKKKSSKK